MLMLTLSSSAEAKGVSTRGVILMTFTVTWADIHDVMVWVYAIMACASGFGFYYNICQWKPNSWLVKVLPSELLNRIVLWLAIPFLVYSAFYYGFLTAHWPY